MMYGKQWWNPRGAMGVPGSSFAASGNTLFGGVRQNGKTLMLEKDVREARLKGMNVAVQAFSKVTAASLAAAESLRNLLASWHVLRPPILNDPPEDVRQEIYPRT